MKISITVDGTHLNGITNAWHRQAGEDVYVTKDPLFERWLRTSLHLTSYVKFEMERLQSTFADYREECLDFHYLILPLGKENTPTLIENIAHIHWDMPTDELFDFSEDVPQTKYPYSIVRVLAALCEIQEKAHYTFIDISTGRTSAIQSLTKIDLIRIANAICFYGSMTSPVPSKYALIYSKFPWLTLGYVDEYTPIHSDDTLYIDERYGGVLYYIDRTGYNFLEEYCREKLRHITKNK